MTVQSSSSETPKALPSALLSRLLLLSPHQELLEMQLAGRTDKGIYVSMPQTLASGSVFDSSNPACASLASATAELAILQALGRMTRLVPLALRWQKPHNNQSANEQSCTKLIAYGHEVSIDKQVGGGFAYASVVLFAISPGAISPNTLDQAKGSQVAMTCKQSGTRQGEFSLHYRIADPRGYTGSL